MGMPEKKRVGGGGWGGGPTDRDERVEQRTGCLGVDYTCGNGSKTDEDYLLQETNKKQKKHSTPQLYRYTRYGRIYWRTLEHYTVVQGRAFQKVNTSYRA